MMSMRKLYYTVGTILLILLIALGYGFLQFRNFLRTPVISHQQNFYFILTPGNTIHTVADALQQKANLKHPLFLVWYVQLTGVSKALKAGEYDIKGPKTIRQVLNVFIKGRVVTHKVTFIEGHTFAQVKAKLARLKNIKHELSYLSKQSLLSMFQSKQKHLEGLFFPDTYQYTYGVSDISILKRAQQRLQKVLQQNWNQRAKNLPYKSPYDALIVASLVEKESALKSEQALIAGVIINRLKKHMFLQIDPTVIYGAGKDYQGTITLADLRADNPYNTYVHKGLPPTPICLPGEDAIHAALNPTNTQYLYFVSKGNGSHAFSTSLKQHDKNIKKYILNKPQNINTHEHQNS